MKDTDVAITNVPQLVSINNFTEQTLIVNFILFLNK